MDPPIAGCPTRENDPSSLRLRQCRILGPKHLIGVTASMPIRIVRLGSERHHGEGVRLGTVRRPPRGVRKAEYAKQNWFDVWLPTLSPSAALMRETTIGEDGSGWRTFTRRFTAELKKPEPSHLLDALAALSHTTNLSVGCYCADEQRCHRSVLRSELKARGASIR
jgi:uncharacterized protein YeaO (DUF488 family)